MRDGSARSEKANARTFPADWPGHSIWPGTSQQLSSRTDGTSCSRRYFGQRAKKTGLKKQSDRNSCHEFSASHLLRTDRANPPSKVSAYHPGQPWHSASKRPGPLVEEAAISKPNWTHVSAPSGFARKRRSRNCEISTIMSPRTCQRLRDLQTGIRNPPAAILHFRRL